MKKLSALFLSIYLVGCNSQSKIPVEKESPLEVKIHETPTPKISLKNEEYIIDPIIYSFVSSKMSKDDWKKLKTNPETLAKILEMIDIDKNKIIDFRDYSAILKDAQKTFDVRYEIYKLFPEKFN